jgi:hypothetical protein
VDETAIVEKIPAGYVRKPGGELSPAFGA